MKILEATQDHLEILVPLFDGYRMFYKQASNSDGARQFLKQRLEREDSIIFLALSEENKPLGFIQLYPSFSSVSMQGTYILNDLFVASTARGSGLGGALLQHAKQFAIKNGSKGLTLETGIDNPAQNLYKRLGWVEDTQVNHYTWEA